MSNLGKSYETRLVPEPDREPVAWPSPSEPEPAAEPVRTDAPERERELVPAGG